MSHTVEKSLHVGKTDTYSITIDPTWLNGEDITSVTVTTDDTYITLGNHSIVDNIIYVYLTGVLKKGGVNVHFDYVLPTRDDCDYIRVIVEDC